MKFRVIEETGEPGTKTFRWGYTYVAVDAQDAVNQHRAVMRKVDPTFGGLLAIDGCTRTRVAEVYELARRDDWK